jgi:glycine/D-amino acid oxidase-like deaminating enzyme
VPRARYGVSPWIDRIPAKRRPDFPRFKGSFTTAPLVIIGGGLAGCMSAYACAAAGIKVVLFEADRIGSGGSGLASGVFASEANASYRELEERAGRRVARAHFDLSRRAALDLAATARRLGMRAHVETADAWRIVPHGWPAKGLKREVEERQDAKLDATWQKTAAVARATAVESEGAMKIAAWGHCDPYALLLGFAKAAIDRGAAFFERTRVRRITFNRKVATVHTAGGRVVAEKVMHCTGEPTDLVNALRRHFRFEERYHVLTEPLSRAVQKQVGPRSTILCDTEVPPHQLHWVDDGALFAGADGPRIPPRGKEKRLLGHSMELMYELSRLYPAISGAQPAWGWALPLAHSVDNVLYAGPHRNFPHQLFALGTSHDPARAFLASRILLRHMLGEATTEDEHFGFARNL